MANHQFLLALAIKQGIDDAIPAQPQPILNPLLISTAEFEIVQFVIVKITSRSVVWLDIDHVYGAIYHFLFDDYSIFGW